MISENPVTRMQRGVYEYAITDETPLAKSPYHRFSVICWKYDLLGRKWKINDHDNDIYAKTAEKAMKLFIIKKKRVND